MELNKCTKCGKVINNNTFTRCEDCWITVSPSGSQPGEPISRKETLKMSSAILTQAEKERYRQPANENIKIHWPYYELERLIDNCANSIGWQCDKVDIIKALKLLAERVKELTDDARARQVATEDHITKLETSLDKLDELQEEINLQELKHNSDFEQRIKTLESAITHTVPYPDNSEQTRNCYACGTTDFKEEDGLNHYGLSVQAEGKPDILLCRKCFIVTPQVRNPLTRIQIEWLLRCVHDLRHGEYYIDENIVEAERLLKFYLGE